MMMVSEWIVQIARNVNGYTVTLRASSLILQIVFFFAVEEQNIV